MGGSKGGEGAGESVVLGAVESSSWFYDRDAGGASGNNLLQKLVQLECRNIHMRVRHNAVTDSMTERPASTIYVQAEQTL